MIDKDLITMQETIAHQQAEIERLSDELYAQQKDILAIRNQMGLLIERVKASMDSSGAPLMADDRPPPHY